MYKSRVVRVRALRGGGTTSHIELLYAALKGIGEPDSSLKGMFLNMRNVNGRPKGDDCESMLTFCESYKCCTPAASLHEWCSKSTQYVRSMCYWVRVFSYWGRTGSWRSM